MEDSKIRPVIKYILAVAALCAIAYMATPRIYRPTRTINEGNAMARLKAIGKYPDKVPWESRGYHFSPIGESKTFAVCAYPIEYEKTGYRTFIVDEEGIVYGKVIKGKRVKEWPGEDPTLLGWAIMMD
jgi:hypothetical protein